MINEFDFGSGCIVGKSKPIKQIFHLIPQLSAENAPVLIQGEKGTGKKLVANAIHARSSRAGAPFIKVNCASLNDTMLEVELFGQTKENSDHPENMKGLFELASGGTILLDGIEALPPLGQEKINQVLGQQQSQEPGGKEAPENKVRVIATTETPLKEVVSQGEFDEKLYTTLTPYTITMPVLRRFREDIPLLIKHFAAKFSKKHHKSVKGISAEALSILMEYDWPGNTKELENCIEQAVMIEELDIIQAHSLPYDLFQTTGSKRQRLAEEFNLRRRLKAFERQLILRALNETKWKKKEAATLMGIDQRNLSYFLKKHHITDPVTREKERGSL